MAGLLLWLTPALWSSNYIIARAASGVLHPHALALGRWTLALLLMLPWVWPERQAIVAEWRQRWPQLLLLGALGMWICGAFVYLGAQGTSATNIGLIYAATPVGIAVAGRWLLHEPGSAAQRVALGLALLGVLFVIAAGEPARLLQARFGAGDKMSANLSRAFSGKQPVADVENALAKARGITLLKAYYVVGFGRAGGRVSEMTSFNYVSNRSEKTISAAANATAELYLDKTDTRLALRVPGGSQESGGISRGEILAKRRCAI